MSCLAQKLITVAFCSSQKSPNREVTKCRVLPSIGLKVYAASETPRDLASSTYSEYMKKKRVDGNEASLPQSSPCIDLFPKDHVPLLPTRSAFATAYIVSFVASFAALSFLFPTSASQFPRIHEEYLLLFRNVRTVFGLTALIMMLMTTVEVRRRLDLKLSVQSSVLRVNDCAQA